MQVKSLPRLCEHCLNPACVASCPSGALYKRDEDGIDAEKLAWVMELKNVRRGRIKEYADRFPRARFLAEARTVARLRHPNIVPIYSVDEREGLVYFVMALVEGENLATRVASAVNRRARASASAVGSSRCTRAPAPSPSDSRSCSTPAV